MANLCPHCGKSILTSKKGWIYCPGNFLTPKCPFKGSYAKSKWAKKDTTVGQIEPLALPSDEQAAIFAAARTMTTNLLAVALAGTGKTTVCVQLIREFFNLGLSSLYLVFGKKDQERAEPKAKNCGKVSTSNSAGYAIIAAYCRSAGIKLAAPTKWFAGNLLEERLKKDGIITFTNGERKSSLKPGTQTAITQIVDMVRQTLPLRANQEGFRSRPDDADYANIMGRFGIEIVHEDLPVAYSYCAWLFTELANLKTLALGHDFTNQVFLPVYHGIYPGIKYQRVIVDECQDQNPYNRQLALMHLMPNGLLVAVGDENQAIYGWRGADSEAIQEMLAEMRKLGGEPLTLPLTLCRRCDKAPLALAQRIVPSIRPLPDAAEGNVRYIKDDAGLLKELIEKRKGLVLCRMNGPIVSLALKLLGQGVRAVLARSNIVGQLLMLVDRLSDGNDKMTVADLIVSLIKWQGEQTAKYVKRRDGEAKIALINDKAACINAIAEADHVQTAGDLKRQVDSLFPENWEEMDCVRLSTVHGAKGGEAPVVYLYSPANKKNVSIFDAIWESPIDRDNTLYVALTRSMHETVVCGPEPTWARMSEGGQASDYEGDTVAPVVKAVVKQVKVMKVPAVDTSKADELVRKFQAAEEDGREEDAIDIGLEYLRVTGRRIA